MYVRAGRPAFARPCVGVHKSTSLMSSSLLLQQCPACLIYIYIYIYRERERERERAHGMVANRLDWDIVVNEFELQPCYCVYFWTNAVCKDVNPFIPPCMG